jgi:hypothetical protein
MSVIEVNNDQARSWAERWLKAGHAVSNAVLGITRFETGRFHTCISGDMAAEPLPNFEEGGVTSTGEADAWLAQTLDGLVRKGAACAIVEHDLARRTDPFLARSEDRWAFIDDRVLAWSDLEPDSGREAVEEIRGVGSGYPSNMFVSTHSAQDLGLVDRQQVPEEFPLQVANSLLAVIMSIFDAESYLVWEKR